MTRLPKSLVIVIAAELDEMVASSRVLLTGRPACGLTDRRDHAEGAGGWPDGERAGPDRRRRQRRWEAEILGLDIATAEDGAGWLAFLRRLALLGLCGVQLVTSDCHDGLRDAIAVVLPLSRRCPSPRSHGVSTLVRTMFEQSGATSVRTQHAQVVTALEAKFPLPLPT